MREPSVLKETCVMLCRAEPRPEDTTTLAAVAASASVASVVIATYRRVRSCETSRRTETYDHNDVLEKTCFRLAATCLTKTQCGRTKCVWPAAGRGNDTFFTSRAFAMTLNEKYK